MLTVSVRSASTHYVEYDINNSVFDKFTHCSHKLHLSQVSSRRAPPLRRHRRRMFSGGDDVSMNNRFGLICVSLYELS